MGKRSILIVDDEVILVDMLTLRLEDSGYEVHCAHDGLEGLAKARAIRPDLIVLDVHMPGMDGYKTLKELRMIDELKKTRIVMLTASGKMKEVFEKEGISDYITKPFDTKDFLRRIDKAIKAKN